MTDQWFPPERALLRVRGCLLATACGHALGLPFDGRHGAAGDDFDAYARSSEPLLVGAPVAVALQHARELTGTTAAPTDALAVVTRRWMGPWEREDGPARIGAGQLPAFPWPDQARRDVGEVLLAMAPVGLLPLPVPEIATLVRASAPAGSHPVVREGAVVVACAVASAFTGDTAREVDRFAFGYALAQLSDHVPLAERMAAVTALGSLTAEDLSRRMGVTEDPVLRVAPAAVAAFLRHPENPAAVIRYAVGLGGATASIAAVAGAVAGARCGGTLLPAAWLRRLRERHRIGEIADALTPNQNRRP